MYSAITLLNYWSPGAMWWPVFLNMPILHQNKCSLRIITLYNLHIAPCSHPVFFALQSLCSIHCYFLCICIYYLSQYVTLYCIMTIKLTFNLKSWKEYGGNELARDKATWNSLFCWWGFKCHGKHKTKSTGISESFLTDHYSILIPASTS